MPMRLRNVTPRCFSGENNPSVSTRHSPKASAVERRARHLTGRRPGFCGCPAKVRTIPNGCFQRFHHPHGALVGGVSGRNGRLASLTHPPAKAVDGEWAARRRRSSGPPALNIKTARAASEPSHTTPPASPQNAGGGAPLDGRAKEGEDRHGKDRGTERPLLQPAKDRRPFSIRSRPRRCPDHPTNVRLPDPNARQEEFYWRAVTLIRRRLLRVEHVCECVLARVEPRRPRVAAQAVQPTEPRTPSNDSGVDRVSRGSVQTLSRWVRCDYTMQEADCIGHRIANGE